MSEVVQLSNTDLRYQRYLRDNQVVQSWQGTANILKCFVAVTGAIHLSEVLSYFCTSLHGPYTGSFLLQFWIMQDQKDISKLRHPGTGMGGYLGYQWGARSENKIFPQSLF